MIHLALAATLTLVSAGEIDALKGEVVHTPGVLAGVHDGNAYTHKDPETPIKPPTNAKTVVSAKTCKKDKKIETKAPLGKGETAVDMARGSIGKMTKATIVLVRGKPADDMFGYAPIFVRVYDSKGKLAASKELPPDAYPCSLTLDDFDEAAGNEVAVGWLSVGAGYTAGATIFKLEEK